MAGFIAVTVTAAGLVGYLLGVQRAGVVELTGHATVGERVATIDAGDWSYGVAGSVTWIDAIGAVHDRGWPTCLSGVSEVPKVRFGATSVTVSEVGTRPVVYVDCRSI